MAFAPVLNLSDLDGRNGFVINGIDDGDYSGFSVSTAGDFNGDGIDDVIIGASVADPKRNNVGAGESYVVFGGQDFSKSLNLSELNGVNGFVINGIDRNDRSGHSVSTAGDFNGDGIDDVIIGAFLADPNGTDEAGESYVVFGRQDFDSTFDLSELNGSNGLIINGIDNYDTAGVSVSTAGDFNGDGIDDVIIGASGADPNGNSFAGESYVVFGGQDFDSTLELSELDGSDGFVINGVNEGDSSGVSVSTAGDLNGDGIDDVIIGAPFTEPNSDSAAGKSYVVFGGQDFDPTLDLSGLDGSNGFVINGIDRYDGPGLSVSTAGDLNGDGIDDLIIGAPGADPNGNPYAGESYVVFGGQDFGSTFDLSDLDGSNGFVINGIDARDAAGRSVGTAGDLNGDGIDDLIIGAPEAVPNSKSIAGESYVVFGGQDFSKSLNLSDLNGSNGFVINGIDAIDTSGRSVSTAGDLNGDGIDDVIIGASRADPNGAENAGESYVVFGRPLDRPSFATSRTLMVAENTPFRADIETVDNRDSEGNGFTYSLTGGADQGVFSIDSSTGELSLDEVPDFETPNDLDRDNVYEVEVTVTDSEGFSDTGLFTIQITDTNVRSPDLADLNGSNGFVISGFNGDFYSSISVSTVGDINGDGFDDVIIGTDRPDPNDPNNFARLGESYVVFGGQDFSSGLDVSELDGSNGFAIINIDDTENTRISVSTAGDLNGDGFDDVIIGTENFDPNDPDNYARLGESYVVFGGQDFSSGLDVSELDGSNGFAIIDIDDTESTRISVSTAGDLNGDGFDDVIFGVPAYASNPYGGESYVVFGGQTFNPSLELSELDGSNGFVINGFDAEDFSGFSVSTAGDFNGDGIDDVIIGAYRANPNGNPYAGASYVVFGGQDFDSTFDLSDLDGSNGFVINGIDAEDSSGFSVSTAGDFNGDGIEDVIIGAPNAYPNGSLYAGESYVVFGGQDFGSTFELSELDGSNGFVIDGIDWFDLSGFSVSNAGDFNGDGFGDVIIGAPYAEPNGTGRAGESYVVFGGQDFDSTLDLSELDGTNGFVINGVDARDYSGFSVSTAGDIDGDGIEDVIIGAPFADPSGNFDRGASYVVFGFTSSGPDLNSGTDFTIPEGTTLVADLEATDASDTENNGLIYRITDGADRSLFSIDAITGELSFITAPDFENPGDADRDNIYEVKVSVTNSIDLSDTQLLNITVQDEDERGTAQVFDVGLFDADTDTLIAALEDSTEINASDIAGRNLTLAAFVPDNSPLSGDIGSVFLNLNDGQVTRRENAEPYALFGDIQGDLIGDEIDFEVGENTLSLDVFSERGLKGGLLETVTRSFTVVDDLVTDVTVGLFDADTDTLIQTIEEGEQIEVAASQNLAIAALIPSESVFFGQVESVFLDLNDGQVTRTENVEPYALFGDIRGDFQVGSGVPLGDNTLTLDLFSDNKQRGEQLGTITRSFTLVDLGA